MSQEKVKNSFDLDKKIKKDIKYIQEDIISKQNTWEELYVKFSKILNTYTVINMPKKQYIKYWQTNYMKYPERFDEILQVIEDKFANGLTPPEEMIDLIEKSKDNEKEKKAAIKLLRKKEMHYGR